MSTEENLDKGIRILSCDSGGPGIYSQLLLIKEYTARLADDLDIDESDVYPADYFDLMGGVGFGGLVAFMLGHLRMTADEAIDGLLSITSAVFRSESEWKGHPQRNTERLEEAIQSLLLERELPIDTRMYDRTDERERQPCKVAVYAATTANVNESVVFRTYAFRDSGFNPTIVEAICATITTPPLFLPTKIGPHPMEQSFVGGGLGANNPTRELFKEASSIFGKDRRVAQIISLGSGRPRALSLNTETSTVGVNELLEDMMADCEMVAHELSTRLTRIHSYLRLSVDRGMENLSVKDWSMLGEIEGHAKVYVENPHIAKAIEASLVCLKDRFGASNIGEINRATADKATAENPFYVRRKGGPFDSLVDSKPLQAWKTKKAQKAIKSLRLSEDLINQINDAPSWPAVIEVVRHHYGLPNLSTKGGLKECYRSFNTVSKNLTEGFDQSETCPRLRGGIVGIWGKLSYDSVIRDQLVPEGILPRIVSMIRDPKTCVIALQTLATITRHGGIKARHEVAKAATPDIVTALRENPSSETIAHLAVPILAHTVSAVYMEEAPTFRQFPTIKMADVIQATYCSLTSAPLNFNFFSHGHEVIRSATRHAYAHLEKNQPALDFMVAGLRVSDLRTRAATLLGLLTFHIHHHAEDPRHLDPMKMLSAASNLPAHLQAVLTRYGPERCSLVTRMKASAQFQKARMKAAQIRDFVELGLEIGTLITLTENSVSDGYLGGAGGESIDVGLPYKSFMGSLPVAAAALRQRDPVKYADMADMIDIKYSMSRRNYSKMRTTCEAAMKRSTHAYWYYMRACAVEEEDDSRLRWAKLGLKCTITTDYLRFGCLELAANSAVDQALQEMENTERVSESWNLALALLHSALEDAGSFVKDAPPDYRGMRDMATVAMLASFVLKGKDLSPDMCELKSIQEKLKHADEFSTLLFNGAILTQWRRSYNTIVERYESVAKFWDSRLEGCQQRTDKFSPGDKCEPQDDLAEWLSTMILEDGQKVVKSGCNHGSDTSFAGFPFIDGKTVFLYQCSFCRNTSASLKKCSRCGTARYCDPNCQKSHWKVHKAHCIVKTPSAT